MNKEELDHIARNPVLITAQQAIELSELCHKFPWFPAPFLLLAAYYHKQGDYRAGDMLQNAALKSSDRGRLYQLLHPSVSHESLSPAETESSKPEHPEIESATPQKSEYAEETVANEVSAVPVEEIITADESDETDIDGPDPEKLYEEPESVPALIEPAEAVYDEILPFTGISQQEEFTDPAFFAGEEAEMAELDSDWEKLPDAGGLIVPSKDDFTHELNEADIIKPELAAKEESEDDASDVIIHEPKEDELKPKLIRQAAVYDIEQYYTADNKTEESDDFFSWLKKPVIANESNEPANNDTSEKTDLIDRFIKTNPSISRPQKDFFIPETAAKKSEHMPDHLATETLAKVFLSQQKPNDAIRIYERLLLKFPEKKPYFAALIEKTRKEFNL